MSIISNCLRVLGRRSGLWRALALGLGFAMAAGSASAVTTSGYSHVGGTPTTTSMTTSSLTATVGFSFTFQAQLNGAAACPCGALLIFARELPGGPIVQISTTGAGTSNGINYPANWSPATPGNYEVWAEFHPTGVNNDSESAHVFLTVVPPLVVAPAALNFTQGSPVNTTFSAGVLPNTCSLSAGALPPGLSLGGPGGCTLSGTPTTIGPYNFTIQVQDSTTAEGSRNYTGSVAASIPTLSEWMMILLGLLLAAGAALTLQRRMALRV